MPSLLVDCSNLTLTETNLSQLSQKNKKTPHNHKAKRNKKIPWSVHLILADWSVIDLMMMWLMWNAPVQAISNTTHCSEKTMAIFTVHPINNDDTGFHINNYLYLLVFMFNATMINI